MRIYKFKAIQSISIVFFFSYLINALLIPEETNSHYFNRKIEPLIDYAKEKLSDFMYKSSRAGRINFIPKEKIDKQYSTWSYIRSLKYLKENIEYQKSLQENKYNKLNAKNKNNNKNNKSKGKTENQDNFNKNNNKKKSHFEEKKKYKRYVLNLDSLMKGFPKYVSEDMREAYEKRYHDHDKRQFDDPIIAEMYKNETRSYFSQDSFNSINFSIYPKNLNLEHNFVKVSIPFKENNSQQIKRYLIRSTELLNNESLKEAKSYPLIDYDYENYIKNQKLVRYLKKKSKTTTAKSTTISNKNTSHEKIRSEKDTTSDSDDEDKNFIFYYFCDDDDKICEKALKVFENAGERLVKLINFKYSVYVYIYYYSFCNHNPSCHSTVMGSAAPSFFYSINENSNENQNNDTTTNNNNDDDDIIIEKFIKRNSGNNHINNKKKSSKKDKNYQSKDNDATSSGNNNNNKNKAQNNILTNKSNKIQISSHCKGSSNITSVFNTPFLSYKNKGNFINSYSQLNTTNKEVNKEVNHELNKSELKESVDSKAREQEVIEIPEENEFLDSNYSYPSALIKQLTGLETESDITVLFNSDFQWDYDGSEQGKKYNLEQTVLHELLHGLGFLSSWYNWFNNNDEILIPGDITLSPESGDYGIMEKPYIFNKYIANNKENEWIAKYQKKIIDDFAHFPEYPFKSHLYKYFKESASYEIARKVYQIMTTPESVSFWCAAPYNLKSSLQRSEELIRPTYKFKYKSTTSNKTDSNDKIDSNNENNKTKSNNKGDRINNVNSVLNNSSNSKKSTTNTKKIKNKRFKMYKPTKTKNADIPLETPVILTNDTNNANEALDNEEEDTDYQYSIKKSKLYVNWLVLYTPNNFLTGTSLSHFDSLRYKKTKNYLMRPYMDVSTSIESSEKEFNNSYGISDDLLCVLKTLGYSLFTDEVDEE